MCEEFHKRQNGQVNSQNIAEVVLGPWRSLINVAVSKSLCHVHVDHLLPTLVVIIMISE